MIIRNFRAYRLIIGNARIPKCGILFQQGFRELQDRDVKWDIILR